MDQKSNLYIPIAIVLAGIIIAGTLYFSGNRPAVAPEAGKTLNQALAVNIKNVKIDGEPFIGDPNAPITMAVWFDYQCPACKYNEVNLMPPLVTDYVKTGKVKVVFKDMAFLGADSQTLALTARAVWEAYPDKYYEWQTVVFTNQGQENTGWATKSVIDGLTKKVGGIDTAVIDQMLAKNSAKYQALLDADKVEATRFGINSTPSFIVSNQLIVGVPQYAQLKSFIQTLIK